MPQENRRYKLQKYIKLGIETARASQKKQHLANSFLGILNSSPKTAKRYPDLIDQRSELWRLGYSLITSTVILLRSILYWPGLIKAQEQTNMCDILLISHLNNISYLKNNEDFYFGDLDVACLNNGLRVHTVLINHCRATRGQVEKYPKKNLTVLSAYLSPLTELKLFLNLVIASFSLVCVGDKKFHKCAKFAQFDHIALGNSRIHEQVYNIILKLKPKALVQTFEGHGWERMVALSAHQMENPITVFGYHHAVLFPGPRAIDFIYGCGADPDNVLMAGSITETLFKKESAYPSGNISVLGSVKHVPVKTCQRNRTLSKCCLLVPEGDMNEVRLMVNSGIEAAKKLPKIKFILRLHPLLNLVKVTRTIPKIKTAPKNFVISSHSLENDIKNSEWLVYRASSVVLNGMSYGLRPIYLNTDRSNDENDPIPNTILFKKIVNNSGELLHIIESDLNNPVTCSNPQRTEAICFANKYYSPLNPSVIIDIVKGFI